MQSATTILTVGHSRHSLERFIELLNGASVTAVADVRASLVSRFSPHFNKSALTASLASHGIVYNFLGKELGGRPERRKFYTQGIADYEKMAASPDFRAGLARLMEAAAEWRVAIMCAEADPLDCHRCLLVGRALATEGINVQHILASGDIRAHTQIEDRLLALENLAAADLLHSRDARLAEAYRARNCKAAYSR